MEDNYIVVECPHCELLIFIYKAELNCKIFRHGEDKKTHAQIAPHGAKDSVDLQGIYGCGKPFRIVGDTAVECSWST